MIKKTFQLAIAIAVVTLMLPSGAMADKIVGVVKSISNKAKMVELDVKGKTVTIPFNKSTKFVPNKKTIKPKFKVIVEFDKNGPAKLIKAKLVKLPKGVTEAKVADVKALLASGKGILIDSRPAKPYGMNHIHGAISIPVSEMKKRMAELGTDKNIQLIFYCGGVTWGMSPKAAGLAVKSGFMNVQAFIDGMPVWKKAKGLLSVKSGWMAKNLAPHLVIVDARSKAAHAKGHIKGAYAFDRVKLKKSLRGLKNKKAPVVVYGSGMKDAESARIAIIKKKYKSVAVLDGGYKAWTQKGLPTAKGKAPKKISYVKKLVPGAIKIADFKKLAAKGGTVILDVRTAAERAKGAIKGSVHIPLDQLKANLGKLNKKSKIIAHCASGVRAGTSYEILKAAGFVKVGFLDARIKIKKKGSFTID